MIATNATQIPPAVTLSDQGKTGQPGPGDRLGWIDAARGLAIILVIYGHVIISSIDAGQLPPHGGWASNVFFIYTFHMPAFMFLTGLFVQERLQRGLGKFLRPLVPTLVWPYLVWGAIALLAERLGGGLRSQVDTSAVDISLLWTPIAWLWFLWALALFHGLAAVLRGWPMALLLLGLMVAPLESVVKLAAFPHQLSHFLMFYALGVVMGPAVTRMQKPPGLLMPVAAAGATLVLALLALRSGQDYWSVAAIPAAIAGSVFLISLAMQPAVQNSRLVTFLGQRSLALYVNHIFFITATRIVLVRVFGVTRFPMILGAALAAALIGPLVVFAVASRLGVTVLAGLGKPVAARGPGAPGPGGATTRPAGELPGGSTQRFMHQARGLLSGFRYANAAKSARGQHPDRKPMP
jgi:fucose 4-O-acetylase-like acetyltransferase